MPAKDLYAYHAYKHKYGKPRARCGFNEALEEIAKTPKVKYGMRGVAESMVSL